jgi:hypothetical protein
MLVSVPKFLAASRQVFSSRCGVLAPEGEPSYHKATPFARRGFCPSCGSPLVFAYEGSPEVWVAIGSLDHPEDWPLVKDAQWGKISHYHVERKVPWLKIEDGLDQRSTEDTPFRDRAARFPLD